MINSEDIKPFWNKMIEKWWFFPLLLFLVMILAYGLNWAQMGYYWDDWEALYFAKESDINPIWEFYKSDRPFSGVYYWLMFHLVGVGPIRWQIATFIIRYISLGGLYFAFTSVWRDADRWVQYATLLLAVFPGFTQSPIALTYSRMFTSFALLTWSFVLTIRALSVEKHKWVYHLISLLFSFLQCLLVEYFVALEAIRFILIYFFIHNKSPMQIKENIRQALLIYLPYAVVVLIYLGYRFVFFETIFGIENNNNAIFVNLILQGNLSAVLDLVQLSFQDILSILFQSYSGILEPEVIQAKGYIYFSFFAGITVTIIIYAACRPKTKTSSQTTLQLMMVGLLSLVLGGLPIWLLGRQTYVGLWSDRFVLAPMVGGVFLMIIFLIWIGQSSKRGALVLSILIGLSVAFQMRNTILYQQEWEQQRSFYWQLYWRAPALKKGTLILSPSMPLSHVSSYALGTAMNYLYDQENQAPQPDYWFINSSRYIELSGEEQLLASHFVKSGMRSVSYEGYLTKVLGVMARGSGKACIRVLDEPYNLFSSFSSFEGVEKQLYQLAQPEIVINTERETPPPFDIFGEEPEHGWCYYFQKADLARQNQDWDTILEISKKTAQQGLKSEYAWEYVPTLMAYAMKEDWNAFQTLSLQIIGLYNASSFSNFVHYVDEMTPDTPVKETVIINVLKAYDYD